MRPLELSLAAGERAMRAIFGKRANNCKSLSDSAVAIGHINRGAVNPCPGAGPEKVSSMSGGNEEDQSRLPDFYVSGSLRPELRDALEQLWPWFWHHVGHQLGDSDRAADLAEEVAAHISRSLEAHPREVRSLVAFCRVAAINYIASTKARESRIDYRGLSRDLEATTGTAAPDWRGEVELWIWVDQVLNGQPAEIRIMLFLRTLGKTWDQVGSVLGLTGGQARLRFYRALRRIDEENRGRQ